MAGGCVKFLCATRNSLGRLGISASICLGLLRLLAVRWLKSTYRAEGFGLTRCQGLLTIQVSRSQLSGCKEGGGNYCYILSRNEVVLSTLPSRQMIPENQFLFCALIPSLIHVHSRVETPHLCTGVWWIHNCTRPRLALSSPDAKCERPKLGVGRQSHLARLNGGCWVNPLAICR